jgi:peptide/nickel transport system permease protein
MAWLVNWKNEHLEQIREHRLTLHLIKRNPLAIMGLCIVIFVLFTAVYPYWLMPYPDHATGAYVNMEEKLLPPSWEHLCGTDYVGRDVLSRVAYGFRLSVGIGLVVISIAMAIGIPLGLFSGYLGGKVDEAIMRVTDIFLAIPAILLALAVNAALGRGIENAMVAIGVSWWPFFTRLVRGQVLAIKEEGFIEAAKTIGASTSRIVFRHVLPNCSSVIIVQLSMQMGYAILMAGALGFLGIGAQPPMPEWGLTMGLAYSYIPNWWWFSAFPGLAMSITILGFFLLGDGMRDALDPKLRK